MTGGKTGNVACMARPQTGQTLVSEDGSVKHLIGMNQDITKRRLAEERLRRSEAEARAANVAKSSLDHCYGSSARQ